jgi:hypothetical protein
VLHKKASCSRWESKTRCVVPPPAHLQQSLTRWFCCCSPCHSRQCFHTSPSWPCSMVRSRAAEEGVLRPLGVENALRRAAPAHLQQPLTRWFCCCSPRASSQRFITFPSWPCAKVRSRAAQEGELQPLGVEYASGRSAPCPFAAAAHSMVLLLQPPCFSTTLNYLSRLAWCEGELSYCGRRWNDGEVFQGDWRLPDPRASCSYRRVHPKAECNSSAFRIYRPPPSTCSNGQV